MLGNLFLLLVLFYCLVCFMKPAIYVHTPAMLLVVSSVLLGIAGAGVDYRRKYDIPVPVVLVAGPTPPGFTGPGGWC